MLLNSTLNITMLVQSGQEALWEILGNMNGPTTQVFISLLPTGINLAKAFEPKVREKKNKKKEKIIIKNKTRKE